MPLSADTGARVMSSPCLMNGVMLPPKARNRHVWPLPNTSFANSMKTGMERRRPSTTWTKLPPDFSGRSIAIGSQSIATASQLKHKLKLKLKPQTVNRTP
jgi:hypothetical protein